MKDSQILFLLLFLIILIYIFYQIKYVDKKQIIQHRTIYVDRPIYRPVYPRYIYKRQRPNKIKPIIPFKPIPPKKPMPPAVPIKPLPRPDIKK